MSAATVMVWPAAAVQAVARFGIVMACRLVLTTVAYAAPATAGAAAEVAEIWLEMGDKPVM